MARFHEVDRRKRRGFSWVDHLPVRRRTNVSAVWWLSPLGIALCHNWHRTPGRHGRNLRFLQEEYRSAKNELRARNGASKRRTSDSMHEQSL